jgi:CheY-like chemotaxis protein
VYGIVKQHKGDVKVETELGRGTTFKVYLPACASKEAEVIPGREAGVPTGHGETILFVEDEDRVREAGQRVLESLGYRVLTASNGQEGLEVFQATGNVALVLTDMVMPVMGGRELIQELTRINPEVKALIITGYMVQEDLQALMEEGFADVVYKPLDVGVLGRTIRQVLGVASKDE